MREIVIAGHKIKTDDQGLYCLNDLWRSRGAVNCEKPSEWSKLNKVQQLVELENLKKGNPCFKQSAGRYGGTYASKALVYDYAMWISPEFKQHVIEVFDSHVTQAVSASLTGAVKSIKLSMVDISEKVNAASIHFDDIKDAGKSWGKASADIRKAKKEATDELDKLRGEIQMKLDFLG